MTEKQNVKSELKASYYVSLENNDYTLTVEGSGGGLPDPNQVLVSLMYAFRSVCQTNGLNAEKLADMYLRKTIEYAPKPVTEN